MGWEQLQPAIQNAFDTYWGRKESQADRAHQLEALQMQLQHETDENEKQRLQDRINAMLQREHEEAMKKIPSRSFVEQRITGGTDKGEGPPSVNMLIKATRKEIARATNAFDDARNYQEYQQEMLASDYPNLMTEEEYNVLKHAGPAVAKKWIKATISAMAVADNEADFGGMNLQGEFEESELMDEVDYELYKAQYEKYLQKLQEEEEAGRERGLGAEKTYIYGTPGENIMGQRGILSGGAAETYKRNQPTKTITAEEAIQSLQRQGR